MNSKQNTEPFEKKLRRLINKLESERRALSKVLNSVGEQNEQKLSNK